MSDLKDHLAEREEMLARLPFNGTIERDALRVLLVESIANLRHMVKMQEARAGIGHPWGI